MVERSQPIRFNLYRTPKLIDADDFFQYTKVLFFLVLHVWKAHPSWPTTNNIHCVYSSIQDLVKSLMHRVGNLIAMHAMQMMAEFGLLPSWLQTYARVNHSGCVFQWCADRFSLPTTAAVAKRFMQSLCSGLEEEIGVTLPECMIKNLACKNFQRASNRAEVKRDVHCGGTPMVLHNANNKELTFLASGVKVVLEGKCLVYQWNFGDDLLTMAEIVETMELPPALSGTWSLTSGALLAKIRAQPRESLVQYNIPKWYN